MYVLVAAALLRATGFLLVAGARRSTAPQPSKTTSIAPLPRTAKRPEAAGLGTHGVVSFGSTVFRRKRPPDATARLMESRIGVREGLGSFAPAVVCPQGATGSGPLPVATSRESRRGAGVAVFGTTKAALNIAQASLDGRSARPHWRLPLPAPRLPITRREAGDPRLEAQHWRAAPPPEAPSSSPGVYQHRGGSPRPEDEAIPT